MSNNLNSFDTAKTLTLTKKGYTKMGLQKQPSHLFNIKFKVMALLTLKPMIQVNIPFLYIKKKEQTKILFFMVQFQWIRIVKK